MIIRYLQRGPTKAEDPTISAEDVPLVVGEGKAVDGVMLVLPQVTLTVRQVRDEKGWAFMVSSSVEDVVERFGPAETAQ